MPEIPEMEIYRNFLQGSLVGRSIIETSIRRERSVNVPPSEFKQWVQDGIVEQVRRRGKYLILVLSTGRCLLAHMMLDGRIYLETNGIPAQLPGEPHVSLMLEAKSTIHFCDLRLGYIKLLDLSEVDEIVNQLGIDPLGEGFTLPAFLEVLNPKRGMIKPLLMDQKTIAGIGNAYSNEALFYAGILPERKVTTLTGDEKIRLYRSILDILHQAIEKGGYIEEKFAHWDNLSGGFIPYFQVYDRMGQPCLHCGSTITQKAVAGRIAYFCTTCQH